MGIWLTSWVEGLPGHRVPSPGTLALSNSCRIFSKSPGPRDSHSHTEGHPAHQGSPPGDTCWAL